MLDCWRTGGANNPETFITAVAAILARYPDAVVYSVTNPTDGLPVQLSWMPSVKEVHDACEKAMEPIAQNEKRLKRIQEQMEARERADRGEKPTLAQLKDRYGDNWGIEPPPKPVVKPFHVPTREELSAHYLKHGLAFAPKGLGDQGEGEECTDK